MNEQSAVDKHFAELKIRHDKAAELFKPDKTTETYIVIDLTSRHDTEAYGPFNSEQEAEEWKDDHPLDDCYSVIGFKHPSTLPAFEDVD